MAERNQSLKAVSRQRAGRQSLFGNARQRANTNPAAPRQDNSAQAGVTTTVNPVTASDPVVPMRNYGKPITKRGGILSSAVGTDTSRTRSAVGIRTPTRSKSI